MKLSSKSHIAVNAMLDVAVHGAHLPVALASVGERQGVSLSYLEQLFRRLRARGLVRSWRGPGGGYQVGKRLSAISVADIVNAVDDASGGAARGAKRGANAVDELWSRLDRHLLDHLRTVTLDAVLRQSGYLTAAATPQRNVSPDRSETRGALAA